MYCVSGVLVLSWYPPGMADDNGEPSDDLVPAILDTAHQYDIQVSLQEEIECPLAHSGESPLSRGIVPPPSSRHSPSYGK